MEEDSRRKRSDTGRKRRKTECVCLKKEGGVRMKREGESGGRARLRRQRLAMKIERKQQSEENFELRR